MAWTASKTGKHFRWPEPSWLNEWLVRRACPYCASNDHAQVIVRAELDRVSTLAGVNRVIPKQLRQRAITEWMRADSMAGQLIHGCGITDGRVKVLRHYIDQMAILEAASQRLRLPSCFGVTVQPADDLIANYQRLDPQAQQLVSDTARRLAVG